MADGMGVSKCQRCAAMLDVSSGMPKVCPVCRSAMWMSDLSVGARNSYEIRRVSARSDDSVTLELKLRNAGHMPNPTLDGDLLDSLKRRAANIGLPIANLLGYTIEFERSNEGKWSIGNLEGPFVES
jgi:hypothetical protein